MAINKTYLFIFCLCALFISPGASALDLEKLNCLRQETQADQLFLSEIHFTKTTFDIIPTSKFEGELISYTLQGSTKTYISGYSLFSIYYEAEIISGLTGDPITRADGTFTLTRMNQANNGKWRFVYFGTDGHVINANFNCLYREKDQAPSPSDMPSR